MVTALLGIGSFAVQGKLSKDAEAGQRESELVQDEREKERLAAAIQLERVRLQVRPPRPAHSDRFLACVTARVVDERVPRASLLELGVPVQYGAQLGD
jgi:hypothetical protein